MNDIVSAVKPKEFRKIPHKYDLVHAISFFYHDELAKLAVDLESTGLLEVFLDLTSEEQKLCEDMSGESLFNWLKESGRETIVSDLTYRQVTAGVISDAANFICESLLACAKGKMAVAFSLLRKPFKENLLLLEWLCSNPIEFIDKFNGESTEEYLLSRLDIDKRRQIVSDAVSTINSPFIEYEFLWDIRYNKTNEYNLETLWTKGTHLVTSVKASATKPGDLNFVFSTASDTDEQWEYYYNILPLLLSYFVQVSEQAVSLFPDWEPELRPIQLILRNIAFIRYANEFQCISEEYYEEIIELFENLQFTCPACNTLTNCRKQDIDDFWLNALLVCNNCSENILAFDLLSN